MVGPRKIELNAKKIKRLMSLLGRATLQTLGNERGRKKALQKNFL